MYSSHPAHRRLAGGLVAALAVVAGMATAAAAMSPVAPSRAERQAHYLPTLRDHDGVKDRHVCEQRGYYFDDDDTRHPTGGSCTYQDDPLQVRSGELLSLRTARAATRVVITPLHGYSQQPGHPRACKLRYSGVWACRAPGARSGGLLRISIAYPKARGNFNADIDIR